MARTTTRPRAAHPPRAAAPPPPEAVCTCEPNPLEDAAWFAWLKLRGPGHTPSRSESDAFLFAFEAGANSAAPPRRLLDAFKAAALASAAHMVRERVADALALPLPPGDDLPALLDAVVEGIALRESLMSAGDRGPAPSAAPPPDVAAALAALVAAVGGVVAERDRAVAAADRYQAVRALLDVA